MDLTRRDFLKASSTAAVAITVGGIIVPQEALGATGGLGVIWLQAAGCTGCSVSMLNSIAYATIDDLLTKTLDVKYQPTIMAAAGDQAVAAAKDAAKGKYVLIVEGAVPTGDAKFCTVWDGMPALNAVKQFGANAAAVIAIGTCAAYGGVPGGAPNPTRVKSVQTVLGTTKKVINIPGCPVHPDWVVGTIAYFLKYGKAPALDKHGRPTDYFAHTVHSQCPYHDDDGGFEDGVRVLSGRGCLRGLGCHGPETRGDCPRRRWNSGGTNQSGVNWCVIARNPCHGCTEPNFPDGMSPFYKNVGHGAAGASAAARTTSGHDD